MVAPHARRDDTADRVAKYEAWAQSLRETLAAHERSTPRYKRFFYGLLVVGYSLFGVGVYPGIYGALCATIITVGGYGLLQSRLTELRVEIEDTEGQIAKLRAGERPSTREV